MSGKNDDEFREIDDKFNDLENLYFPFNSDEKDEEDEYIPPTKDEMIEMALGMSEMMSRLMHDVLILVPKEMQDTVAIALDAATSSIAGKADESNRNLKQLKKIDKSNAGIYLAEARNYKLLLSREMRHGGGLESKNLQKEKKALDAFLKYESDSPYVDFDDYMWARIEKAKVSMFLGELKGVFNAYIEIPDDDFDMMDVVNALGEWYEEGDDDVLSDNHYMFLSDSGAAIAIEYSDPASLVAEAEPEMRQKYLDLMENVGASAHALSITVTGGSDLIGASYDFQQVLTAVWSLYSESELAIVYDYPYPREKFELLADSASKGIFCLPYLAEMTIEPLDGSTELALTWEARRWGKIDLGIILDSSEDNPPDLALLCDIFTQHIEKPFKEGQEAVIDGSCVIFRKKMFEDHEYLLVEKKEE